MVHVSRWRSWGWKFWFYLSLCDNAMGSKHKLNNQHIHFHFLIHTLAGLNENQYPRVQFQELLHITWPDLGACPNTGKLIANPQSPNKMIRLPTPYPQKKLIDRSSNVMVAKYQKLCRHSKRIFRAKGPHRHWGPFLRRSRILDFWVGVGVSWLLCVWIEQHCHAAAPRFYQTILSNRQRYAISHVRDCVVTFLSDCSRRGGRGRPVTCAESRFSSVQEWEARNDDSLAKSHV